MNNDVTVLQSDYNRIKKHTPTYQVIFGSINISKLNIYMSDPRYLSLCHKEPAKGKKWP